MASGSSNAYLPAQQGGASDTPQALKSWWNTFKKRTKKDPAPPGPQQPATAAIFGVPLVTSIRYANVAISLMQDDQTSYTYGYIPIIVAKCGVFLKDKATEVQGIFRLAGSARRMNQLQEIFNTPDKYGKGLDWDGYTVHDAANVLRRYLNQLPEPIIPLALYEPFRAPLRQHQLQAVGNVEAKESDIGNFDYDTTIATYRDLITKLPPLNRQLLLYILDMLAIFAAKASINQMTAANLAVIFQPGMLHHPEHDKLPGEYRLSQDVVIFLIDQQDNFLLDMAGVVDEKTKKEIESGPLPAPATPTRAAAAGLGRSVSTTSRSTNSSRIAGIRRNLSVSSRGSRASVIPAGPGTPGTPNAPGTPGVHRSNTVPSRKSPAVNQGRFNRPGESPNATPPTVTPDMTVSPPPHSPAHPPITTIAASPVPSPEPRTGSIAPSVSTSNAYPNRSRDHLLGGDSQNANASGAKPRTGLSNLLRSPPSDDGQARAPNKLRKKRQPTGPGMLAGAHSSAASLSAADPDNARSPNVGPIASGDESSRQVSGAGYMLNETVPTPRGDVTPQPIPEQKGNVLAPSSSSQLMMDASKPRASPKSDTGENFPDSRYDTSTGNEYDNDGAPAPEKKRRWRFSVSAKKNHDERQLAAGQGSTANLGGHSDADLSKASGSSWRHQGSNSNVGDGPMDLQPDALRRGSRDNAYTSEERSPTTESSGKGPLSWFKRKIKEREDKEADKDRAKSPHRSDAGHKSNQSLSAAVNGEAAARQVSSDLSAEPLSESHEEDVFTLPGSSAPTSFSTSLGQRSQPLQTPSQPILDTSTNVLNAAPHSGTLPIVPGRIEDYMNDSDREKLHTAREAAQRNSLLQPADESTTPKTAEISIDPSYKVPDDATKGNVTEPEPTTPKASEANAGLRALTSTTAVPQPLPDSRPA